MYNFGDMEAKKHSTIISLVFVAVIFFFLNALIGNDTHNRLSTRAEALEATSEKYLFYPSLVLVAGGRKLNTEDFTSSGACQSCHSEIHNQWNGSLHFNSFRDPVWQALWTVGHVETDGEVSKECLSCHTPIGILARRISKPEETEVLDELSAAGVQCDFCHTVSELNHYDTTTKTPHNMAFTSDPGDIKRGPFNDSDSPIHKSAYSEAHTSAEFCGNCHNVYHPENGLAVESTYDEWKISPYAENGIACQHCHMIPVEKLPLVASNMKPIANPGLASEMGPERPDVFTHEFVGGNTAIYTMLGASDKNDIAIKRLKSAASLEIAAPKTAPKPGDTCEVTVNVTNSAAGHNLPTGLPEVRQMWLELKVEDAKKRLIYHTGMLKADGNLGRDAYVFDVKPTNAEGKFTVKPWEMAAINDVKTIPPKKTAARKYKFRISSKAITPISITATLHFRSFSPAFLKKLLGDDTAPSPVIDMVSKTIFISK